MQSRVSYNENSILDLQELPFFAQNGRSEAKAGRGKAPPPRKETWQKMQLGKLGEKEEDRNQKEESRIMQLVGTFIITFITHTYIIINSKKETSIFPILDPSPFSKR